MEAVYFLPSEIARLVLGYIKEEGYKSTCRSFLKECCHLSEYVTLLKRGLECPTTINALSLSQILEEYAKLKLLDIERRSMTASVCTLWRQLESIITNLKDQTSSKQTSIQRSRTRRQLCNNRLCAPNETRKQRITRRTLNLNNTPDCDNHAQTAMELGSSANVQDTMNSNMHTSCVTIKKSGNTPISPKAVQENSCPIRNLSTLLGDWGNRVAGGEPKSLNISENRDNLFSPGSKHQTDLCNDRVSLNTKNKNKLTSSDTRSSFKCQNLSVNSSHDVCDEIKSFSGSEDNIEFEDSHVTMEADFNMPHNSSPNEKTCSSVCDTGDFNISKKLHGDVASPSTKDKEIVKFCENSGSVKKIRHVPENVCCLQDISLAQQKSSINSANVCLNNNTIMSTISIETTIVGSVACRTTALHLSDSGLAPCVSSELRCSEDEEVQSSSTEKTPSEIALDKTDCAASKSLFPFSTITPIENSPQKIYISEVISPTDEPASSTTQNSASKNLIPLPNICSETPVKLQTAINENCSNIPIVFTPIKQCCVSPSKTKSETVTLVSDIKNSDEDSQPPFQFSLLKTPVKYISWNEQGRNIGKSPRRKRPPRKRSGPFPDRSDLVLADSNESVQSSAGTTQDDSIPLILEQILGNKTLHEKLAESINRGLHVDCSSTSRHLPLSAKQVKPKSSSDSSDTNSSNSQLTNNNETQQTLEEILDIHENQMSTGQIGAIIDMTQNDPAFDALFNLFHVDKNEYIEREYLSLRAGKQASPFPSIHSDSTLPVNSLESETSFTSNLKEKILPSDHQDVSTDTAVANSIHILPSDLEAHNNKGLVRPVENHSLLVDKSDLYTSKQPDVAVYNRGHLDESSRTALAAHLGKSPGLSTIKSKDLLALGMSHVTCEDELSGDDNRIEQLHKTSKSKNSKTSKMSSSKSKSRVSDKTKATLCCNTATEISAQPTMPILGMDNFQALQSLFNFQNLPQADTAPAETEEISKFGSASARSSQPPTFCNTLSSQAFTEPVVTSYLQQPIVTQTPSTVSSLTLHSKKKVTRKLKAASKKSSVALPKLLPKSTVLSTGFTTLMTITSPQMAAKTGQDQIMLSGLGGYKTVSSTEGSELQQYIPILSPGGCSYFNVPFVSNSMTDISSQASETSHVSSSCGITVQVPNTKSELSPSEPRPVYIAMPVGKTVPKPVHARTLNFGSEVETKMISCIRQPSVGRRQRKRARLLKESSSCDKPKEVDDTCRAEKCQESCGDASCVDSVNSDALVESSSIPICDNFEPGSNKKTSDSTVNESKYTECVSPEKSPINILVQNIDCSAVLISNQMQNVADNDQSFVIEEKNAALYLPDLADDVSSSENSSKKVVPIKKNDTLARNEHSRIEGTNTALLCMPDLVVSVSSSEMDTKKVSPMKKGKIVAKIEKEKYIGTTEKSIRKRGRRKKNEMKTENIEKIPDVVIVSDVVKFIERNSDVFSQKIKGKSRMGKAVSNTKKTKSPSLTVHKTKARNVKKKSPSNDIEIEDDDNQSLASLRRCLRAMKDGGMSFGSSSGDTHLTEQVSDICPNAAKNTEHSNWVNSCQSNLSVGAGSLDSMENVTDKEQFQRSYPNTSYRDPHVESDCGIAANFESSNSSDFLYTETLQASRNLEHDNAVLHSSNIGDIYSAFQLCTLDEKKIVQYISSSEEEIDIVGEFNFPVNLRKQLLKQQTGPSNVETGQAVSDIVSENSNKSLDRRGRKCPAKCRPEETKSIVLQPSFQLPPKHVETSPNAKSNKMKTKSIIFQTQIFTPMENKASNNENTVDQNRTLTPSKNRRSSPRTNKGQNKHTCIFTDETCSPRKTRECFLSMPNVRKDEDNVHTKIKFSSTKEIVKTTSKSDHFTNVQKSTTNEMCENSIKKINRKEDKLLRNSLESPKKHCNPINILDGHVSIFSSLEPLTNATTNVKMGISESTATKSQPSGVGKSSSGNENSLNGSKRKRADSGEIEPKKEKLSKDTRIKKPRDLASLDVEKFLSKIHH